MGNRSFHSSSAEETIDIGRQIAASLEANSVVCLTGDLGAGKTTLLRLILGFLRPTSGEARGAGQDCYRQRVNVHRDVAYLPGDARLFRPMRGRQVLKFFGHVSLPVGMSRVFVRGYGSRGEVKDLRKGRKG